MSKPDFERCVKTANELLSGQDLFCQMLNVEKLVYDKEIIFDSIQNYALYTKTPLDYFMSKETQKLIDGCMLIKDGVHIVLYNSGINYIEKLNWTLAHEIGHIYLGHTRGVGDEEIEAHFFAAQLLMPTYTIYRMSLKHGAVNGCDLAEIFGVSPEAANKRINTMKKLFYMSSTVPDQAIWEIQEEKIDIYFDCKRSGHDFCDALLYVKEMKEEQEREYFSEMVSLYH